MASSVRVIAIGNSAGVILSEELLAKLHVERGDELFVVKTPRGIELTPYQPDFHAKVEVARRIMRENRDVLRKLAE